MAVLSRISHIRPGPSPLSAGEEPWWDSLREDCASVPVRFSMTGPERAVSTLTASIDVAARTAALGLFGLVLNPARWISNFFAHGNIHQKVLKNWDPVDCLEPPAIKDHIKARPARGHLFQPDDGICENLYFESHYDPVNPKLRRQYLLHRANRIVHARYWRKLGDTGRPVIIAVHGFSASSYWFNEWYFDVQRLYRLGFDVVLFTKPFHGYRQARVSLLNGYQFLAGGPAWINEACLQAVTDLRTLLHYLKDERGAAAVGITGMSLGGYVTSLFAGLEPRLDFAIPINPVVDIPDLALEWQPAGAVMRALLFGAERSLQDFRHAFAISCPLTYPARIPPERLLIIGSTGDRMATPAQINLLWEHWKRPPVYWTPGSHLVPAGREEMFRGIEKFLRSTGFIA